MLPNIVLTILSFYALLTAGLVAVVFGYRSAQVMLGRSPANVWPRRQPAAEPALIQRSHDAHKNCVESFPLWLVALLVMGHDTASMEAWGWLLPWLFALRLAQSLTHLLGTPPALVFLRGLFFAGQLLGLGVIVALAVSA